MSAASPAHNQVRRNVAAAPSRAPQGHAYAQSQAPVRPLTARSDEEFRLNLSDLPISQDTLDVDGLKPSLLSRLFDLISPLRRK